MSDLTAPLCSDKSSHVCDSEEWSGTQTHANSFQETPFSIHLDKPPASAGCEGVAVLDDGKSPQLPFLKVRRERNAEYEGLTQDGKDSAKGIALLGLINTRGNTLNALLNQQSGKPLPLFYLLGCCLI